MIVTRSHAQQSQQITRDRAGRYEESTPCEACGKPAGFDYWSLSSPNGGGLTLCHRKRCPANVMQRQIPDFAQYEAAVKAYIRTRLDAQR